MGFISTTADSISSGGTVTGDLTVDADLTVTGSTAITVNEVIQGTSPIDITNAEALLVRKNSDGGDIFTVDTDTPLIKMGSAVSVGTDGAGYDVTFHSGTAGDSFVWDASEEKLTITGTSGQTALDIADGNLVITKDIKILDTGALTLGTDGDAQIWNDGSNTYIRNNTSDQDIIFRVNDGGVANTEVLRIDGATGAIGMNTDTPSSGCLELASRILKLSGHTTSGWGAGMIGIQSNVLTILAGSSGINFWNSSGSKKSLMLELDSRISISNNDGNTGNTVLGYKAFTNNGTVLTDIDQDYSVAIGHLAMGTGTKTDSEVSSANVAIGYESMTDATTAGSNTAIGYHSLKSLTTGQYSTAIGASALYSETIGNQSLAIGISAGYSQVSDSPRETTANTIVGTSASYYNITGTNNTLIGWQSAFGGGSTASHSNNTAVGKQALGVITTGSENVAIGSGAGDALVNGGNNVIIGYNAEGNDTDAGNCIVIGSEATGINHNSVTLGNADITATYLASGANDANVLYIGDTANASMTVGLTINQGAADNEILAFKSSDVSHAMTAEAEADTYGKFFKHTANAGGLQISGLRDADGVAEGALSFTGLLGEAADTTKSTSGGGVINLTSVITNGSTGATAVGSDGNLVVIHNGGSARFIFDAEGSGHADVEWVAFSDSRLKSSIEDVPYGLAEVLQLQPKRFDKQSGCFDENGDIELEDNKRRMIGFLAQDVKAIIPEIVKDVDETDSFYAMDDGKLMAVLVKAVQELTAKVEELERKA